MQHLIIGTAGHVDHGKTSLVKLLTGTDCDTHQQEKQRGITINLGFTHLELPNGESAGIIDVPGHKDFINTMIGGACGIDMVLLVIAADSGIMPQTVEHMNIISALGIRRGVVALTKADLVDDELLEMAEYEISDFLASTALKDAPIIPVSATTGMGKDALINAIAETVADQEARVPGQLFRMYADRIFSVKGFGSVVTGSVLSGTLSVDQQVFLLPENRQRLRVRAIERHGKAVNQVVAGDRAAVNLIGLQKTDFERGMVICDRLIESTSMIDARVQLFDIDLSFQLWSNILLISGTFECQARMHLLDKNTLKGKEEAIVQIHLSKPAVLMRQDKFIIRNSSEDKTVGGGYVIESSPLHHRKRAPALVDELTRLSTHIGSGNSLREIINVALKKAFRPFTPEELAAHLNLKPEELVEEIRNPGTGFVVYSSEKETILVNEHCDASYRIRILKAITDHHRKNPLFSEGLDAMAILGKLGLSKTANGKVCLHYILRSMQAENKLDLHQQTWIIKGHTPSFDKKSMEEIAWLEQEILQCGDNKPVLAEIEEKAASRRIPKHMVKTYLLWLSGQERIRFCKADFIHTDILNQYRAILLGHLAGKPEGMEIDEFKEVITGTKRFRALLIDFLEAENSLRLVAGDGVATRLFVGGKY